MAAEEEGGYDRAIAWLLFFGIPYSLVALFGAGDAYRGTRCTLALWRSVPCTTWWIPSNVLFFGTIVIGWAAYFSSILLAFYVITSSDALAIGKTYPPIINILKDIVALL